MKNLYRNFLITGLFASLTIVNCSAQESYLDSSFGINGIVSAPLVEAKAMALQQDGRIVVVGGTYICRFDPDGTPDSGFGTQGKTDIGATGATGLLAIAELGNGKLLALGKKGFGYAFVRLNTDGTLDTSFGVNGLKFMIHEFSMSGTMENPCKMILLPNGKIMSLGTARSESTAISDVFITRAMVARYNADLSLDLTFNGTGYTKFDGSSSYIQARDLAVNSDGSVVAGIQIGGDVKLWKFLQSGQVDGTFGNSGSKVIDLGSADDRLNNITITGEGKLLISGSKSDGFHSAILYRTLANGMLDATYGNGGIFTLPNTSGSNEVAVQSVILNDNRAISGLQLWNNSADYALLFTNPDGTVDTASGNDGKIITPLDNLQSLTCIAQQPDGKILAAGFDQFSMVLARYNVSEALSVHDFNPAGLNISAYPNPASDRITISGLQDGTVIALYNISGQKIRETVSSGDTAINLNGLPPGMYFVNTAHGSTKIMKK